MVGNLLPVRRVLRSNLLLQLPVLFLWLFQHYHDWSFGASLGLVAVYEIFVFVYRFLRQVGFKSWQELRPELEAVLVGWITNFVRDAVSRFRRRYKRRIAEEYNLFNIRGLGLLHSFTLDLTQVFVELRVTASSGRFAEGSDTASIWHFLRNAQSRAHQRKAFAVIGPPGSGKTTLLQHVALTLARNAQREHRVRPMLPLFFYLRDLAPTIHSEGIPLGELAQRRFRDEYWTLTPPKGWFERQLFSGRCMVLLDGLDEIANVDIRAAVAAWIDRQIANYPRAKFIVSARPLGYREAPLRRADMLEVLPFKPQQVERFINQWYLANAIASAPSQPIRTVRRRAQNDANDLMKRLMSTPALEALTVNPLLLTMITMVHRYRGALPGNRVELYDEICEVLLGRWRQSKGIQDTIKSDQKRAVLQALAAYMMASRVREIPTMEANCVVRPIVDRIGSTSPEDFLPYLQESSGLLLEKEAGRWSFAHFTFQEYLAASHWHKTHEPPAWETLISDSWWHEAIRLYAAKGDATEIIVACLAEGSLIAFELAAECLDEASEIDLEVRRRASEWLDTSIDAGAEDRRNVASAVKLRRRLKSLQRLKPDSDVFIDSEFLTVAEYEYFCTSSNKAEGSFRYPDHWRGLRGPDVDRRQPVTGVRIQDVQELVRFVGSIEVGISSFRLPSATEALAVRPQAEHQGTLCTTSQGFGTVGLDEISFGAYLSRLHLRDEPAVPAVGVDDLLITWGDDFGKSMNLRDADRALSSAIGADVRGVFLPFAHAVLRRPAALPEDLRQISSHSAVILAKSRRESLYTTAGLSRDLDEIAAAMVRGKFEEASVSAGRLQVGTRSEDDRFQRLLQSLLRCASSNDSDTYDRALLALARMSLHSHLGYAMVANTFSRWLARNHESARANCLRLYWTLLLIRERWHGRSSNLDGIRIVRERVSIA